MIMDESREEKGEAMIFTEQSINDGCEEKVSQLVHPTSLILEEELVNSYSLRENISPMKQDNLLDQIPLLPPEEGCLSTDLPKEFNEPISLPLPEKGDFVSKGNCHNLEQGNSDQYPSEYLPCPRNDSFEEDIHKPSDHLEIVQDTEVNEQHEINHSTVHLDEDVKESEQPFENNDVHGEVDDNGMNLSNKSENCKSADEMCITKDELPLRSEEKEEGELEEGELEDDEEIKNPDEDIKEKETPVENSTKEKEGENETGVVNEEEKTPEKLDKERTLKKRYHKDGGEESRKRKKRRHHRHQGDLDEDNTDEGVTKHKKTLSRGVTYDYDVLLQNEIEKLVGSDAENLTENDQSRIFKLIKQCRNRDVNEEELMDSLSGDEWEDKRRRVRRHKRSSRSPGRNIHESCMYFLLGNCRRGKLCPYSHDCAPKPKMELCKFYMMDCCAKKSKCLYMHNDFPCKYFHFGMKCEAGETCKFSHDSLEEVTKNILLKHIELAPKDILGDFPRVTKESGDIIISVTQAKKTGQSIDSSILERVREFEGRGFKYLDKAMKHLPKREASSSSGGVDKEEGKEKEDMEKSPYKNRNRESYPSASKERDRDRGERERDRYLKRERTRERDRQRSRGEDSTFSRRIRGSSLRNSSGFSRSREDRFPESRHNIKPLLDSPRDQKWYSSDEEDQSRNVNLKGYRNSDFRYNPKSESGQSEEGLRCHDDDTYNSGNTNKEFLLQTNLPDIDVMYLKNVLSAVQNQVNKDRDESMPNQVDDSSSTIDNYTAIANDIKEVFGDSAEKGQTSGKKPLLSSPPRDSFAGGDRYFREQMKSNNTTFRSNSTEERLSSFRSDPRIRNVKHYSDCNEQDGQPEIGRYRRISADDREDTPRNRNLYDSFPEERLILSSNDRYPFDRDDITHQNSSKDPRRRVEFDKLSKKSLENDLKMDHSIYSIQEDFGDEISLPENFMNEEMSMPFKVPMHSSAKEIDASYNPQYAIYYRMVKIDVPKPDFSRLKINKEDPKIMDDPRLRKMFRRKSADHLLSSPKSGFYDSVSTPSSPPYEERIRAARGSVASEADRDPRRKIARKDPRMESNSISQLSNVQQESTIDPRIGQSTVEDEFRMMNRAGSMNDIRIDSRDRRFDMRDQERFESDLRFGSFPLPNDMLGNNQDFIHSRDIPNMAKPGLHQGMDPRGRPGLLGPGPLPNALGLSNIAIQLPPAVLANPFLIAQNLNNPAISPFPLLPAERMSNPDLGRLNFEPPDQRQWNARRPDTRDPRFKRD